MSSREVEVSVQAEGVEDAAGEFEAGEGGEGGGAPDVSGAGGRGGKGGIGGKLITRLLGLLAFLGPILDVVGVVADVLTAFMAPVAVLLLRLLQPVLRLMIKALPLWFDLVGLFITAVDMLGQLWNWAAGTQFGKWLSNLPDRIWDFMQRLPEKLGSVITENIPGIGGDAEQTGNRVLRDAGTSGAAQAGSTATGIPQPVIELALEGGLDAFVDEVTQDSSVDWP